MIQSVKLKMFTRAYASEAKGGLRNRTLQSIERCNAKKNIYEGRRE